MIRRLSKAIKRELLRIGLDGDLWQTKFMFKMGGAYYFKVIYDSNTSHGEYLVWSCYFSGDHFVFEAKESEAV